jgi:hypothetical protein
VLDVGITRPGKRSTANFRMIRILVLESVVAKVDLAVVDLLMVVAAD